MLKRGYFRIAAEKESEPARFEAESRSVVFRYTLSMAAQSTIGAGLAVTAGVLLHAEKEFRDVPKDRDDYPHKFIADGREGRHSYKDRDNFRVLGHKEDQVFVELERKRGKFAVFSFPFLQKVSTARFVPSPEHLWQAATKKEDRVPLFFDGCYCILTLENGHSSRCITPGFSVERFSRKTSSFFGSDFERRPFCSFLILIRLPGKLP